MTIAQHSVVIQFTTFEVYGRAFCGFGLDVQKTVGFYFQTMFGKFIFYSVNMSPVCQFTSVTFIVDCIPASAFSLLS